jgi:hypothetical protein
MSVLGQVLFDFFINDLCNVISHSNGLLFADDLKYIMLFNHLVVVYSYSPILIVYMPGAWLVL